VSSKYRAKAETIGLIGDNGKSIIHNHYGWSVSNLWDFHEYVDNTEKYILKFSVTLLVISIVVFWLAQFLVKDVSIFLLFVHISSQLLACSIFVIFIRSTIRYKRNRGAFWKLINKNEKVIIREYLDYVQEEIESNFGNIDVTFKHAVGDLPRNYVPLSGEIPQQAIEEIVPKFRRQIKNLDKYILSPVNRQIFIYGPPGSGKSTTLYKTFVTYKSDASRGIGNHIPIFIHANQILKFLLVNNSREDNKVGLCEFLRGMYSQDSPDAINNFVEHIILKKQVNYVIIIDALDEFSDKTNRDQLFDLLSSLIKTTSKTGIKWILSCREDESNAYRHSWKVTNIRIKPMSLIQMRAFLSKRLKHHNYYVEGRALAQRIMNNIQLREGQNRDESFLNNPYYLSLWLYHITTSETTDDCSNPSIDILHSAELAREMRKEKSDEHDKFPVIKEIDNKLIKNIITTLSVLSFYHLKISLKAEGYVTTSITNVDFLEKLFTPISVMKSNNALDDVTRNRLGSTAERQTQEKDRVFVIIKNSILAAFECQSIPIGMPDDLQLIDFAVIVASILERSYSCNLIKLDIEEKTFLGFLNRRTGDYFAARFLRDSGLREVLEIREINFWLSRSIAIALASSKDPQKILDSLEVLPQDHIFESAIVDGLLLISPRERGNVQEFIKRLIKSLLNPDRLSGDLYHPCDPLRILRQIRVLCTSGYSEYITLGNSPAFLTLLSRPDVAISEAAILTYLTHSCHIKFSINHWTILIQHLLRKSLKFNSIASFSSLWIAIKDVKR
jgi:Cdc6-like AAA superfamily ATPase